MGTFEGFNTEFFDFFKELSDNNSREWFTSNKKRYDSHVVAPILAFITDIQPHLKKISPYFLAEPKKVGGSMFRINRDVRFSKDKKPYKENAGCQFRHVNGRDAHAPGFYLHLEPDNIFFGGGIWMPDNNALRSIRTAIVEKSSDWQRVLGDKKFNEKFKGVEGESLSRPPRDFPADHKFIDDIKRKSFFAMHKGTASNASEADFVKEVAGTFAAAKPLMRFLCRALEQEF